MRTLLLFFVACVAAYAADTPIITVQGESKGTIAPDTAEWNFTIYSTADTVDAAAGAAYAARDRMISRFADLKLPHGSLVADGISQGALWGYRDGRRLPDGFFSELSFKLKINGLSLYDAINEKFFLDDKIQVQNVSLSSSNEAAADRAQIAKALADARARAEAIATQLGVRLGPVRYVQCIGYPPTRDMLMGGMRSGESVIPPLTSIPVSATVQVGYAIGY